MLPARWSVDGRELVWTSPVPLRMGDARYEVRSGQQLLGYPEQRGDTLRLPITGPFPSPDLSVWVAGRRLDIAAPRRAAVAPTAEAAVPTTSADPAAPGRYRTQRLRYDLPPLSIDGRRATVVTLTLPVDADGRVEPDEAVALVLLDDGVIVPDPIELLGRVPAS